jgi:hypothetical protein
MNWKWMWKAANIAKLKNYPAICLEGPNKTTKISGQLVSGLRHNSETKYNKVIALI